MRTTVQLDVDTARAVEDLRKARGMGMSEAINELIRTGLLPRGSAAPFHQRTAALGLRIDVSNVADALDALDGPNVR